MILACTSSFGVGLTLQKDSAEVPIRLRMDLTAEREDVCACIKYIRIPPNSGALSPLSPKQSTPALRFPRKTREPSGDVIKTSDLPAQIVVLIGDHSV
jgi:hypothetical protein